MSEPAKPTQTCERCGEWGCESAFHPEAGSELAMVATTGALLGASLLGLLALPHWLRRFDAVDAPSGHPRQRLRQDRVATAVVSALAMATLTLAGLTVAAVEHSERGPAAAFTGASETLQGSELDEILHLIEHGSPAQATVGIDQLMELVPELSGADIQKVDRTHQRMGPAAGWSHDRAVALRDALRASDHAEAAEALAKAYPHIEDRVERAETVRSLGLCASPEALGEVIRLETERYRTPALAHLLNVGCVQHVAHELFGLADAHPAERPWVYRALSESCEFRPNRMRDAAGATIAERWIALSSRSAAEQAAPSTHFLAHLLSCADESMLDRALQTMPPAADEHARAEVAIATYRRGRRSLDSLFDDAVHDEALRRRLRERYEGSAPWRDALLQDAPEAERAPRGEAFDQAMEHYLRLGGRFE